MSAERDILVAACENRKAYDLIEKHWTAKDMTEPGKLVLSHISDYYERDPSAKSVHMDTLRELVLQSVTNPKHKETFETVLNALEKADLSGINVATALVNGKMEALESKIASAFASGKRAEGQKLLDEYRELTETGLDVSGPQPQIGLTVDDIIGETGTEELIHMYPQVLDQHLDGGLVRGHHVLLFARPEMGKTLFLINAMRGFLRQGLRVLYCGNEEPIKPTALRMIGRLCEWDKFEVASNREQADRIAEERGYLNWIPVHLEPGTPREIEALVEEYKPDVLVVDQIRHLYVKDDSFPRQLEKACVAVRNMAARHNCLAISVTQAGESAAGKPVLDMEDVEWSNTGVQGAVDVMIGLSASREDEEANRRVLSLPKNKRSGNHGFFPVGIDIPLNKLTSMMTG